MAQGNSKTEHLARLLPFYRRLCVRQQLLQRLRKWSCNMLQEISLVISSARTLLMQNRNSPPRKEENTNSPRKFAVVLKAFYSKRICTGASEHAPSGGHNEHRQKKAQADDHKGCPKGDTVRAPLLATRRPATSYIRHFKGPIRVSDIIWVHLETDRLA